MSDLVLALIKQSAVKLKANYPTETATLSSEFIEQALSETLTEVLPDEVTLATTRPDYESVLFQLMRALESTPAWNDRSLSATGQMFLRAIASDVAYTQFSIVRAVMEMFPQTARNPSSIYAHARRLGVRLTRKLPQAIDVSLTRPELFADGLVVPKYTQWLVGGVRYFNRQSINFSPDNLTVKAQLFQGVITEASVLSTGVNYQEIEVGNEDWSISDQDLIVYVNTEEWRRVTDPLFLYRRGDRVFHENSLSTGNVALTFGNGSYGARPPVGAVIRMVWAETQGNAAPAPLEQAEITMMTNQELGVVGTALALAVAGKDEMPLEYYQRFGSDLHAMQPNKAAHRRVDHRALALAFPGVYDVRFTGEAERTVRRPSHMNVVKVTLLTDPVFTARQWEEFAAYFESGVPFKPLLTREDAEAVICNLSFKVFAMPDTDLGWIENTLKRQLKQLFEPMPGKLGRSIYADSIFAIMKGKDELADKISYTQPVIPVTDAVVTSIKQWIKLGTVTLDVKYSTRDYPGRIS